MDAEALEELMAGKADEDLGRYIDDTEKYTPEAIAAAVTECQKRGRSFSEFELERIRSIVEQKREAREKEFDLKRDNFEECLEDIVDDPGAPEYYSKPAIIFFCLAFTVFAGAVLMAINAKYTKLIKWGIVMYGLLYAAMTIYIRDELIGIRHSFKFIMLFNFIGSLPLTTIFWNSCVGSETKYRAKSIWERLHSPYWWRYRFCSFYILTFDADRVSL